MAHNKIIIVIVSYNAERLMQENINSLRRTQPAGSYKIVVVDNASTDGIAEWLSEQQDILFIPNNTNIGFGPACNQAVAATKGTEYEDYDVFLLNNDTVMTSTAIPKMTGYLASHDDVGAVGAMSNYAGNRQEYPVVFSSTEEYLSFGESLNSPEADAYVEKTRLNGFAMLIRRKVWDAIGGFDEDFAPGYYEDDALSIEILKLGYRLVVSRDSFIYHVGSASFVKSGLNHLAVEHHDLFVQKYKFDIVDYAYPCGAVISQIPFARDAVFSVLHIGCGIGAEMKAIRSLFHNATVFGIETDPIMFDIVSKTEPVYRNIEDAATNITVSSLDLIIVDERILASLTDEQKTTIAGLCKQGAYEISRIHKYDDYDFDEIKLVIWDVAVYNEAIANLLANWGIMSTVYEKDNLRSRIKAYGMESRCILLISSDALFRTNTFLMFPELKNEDTSVIPYLCAHFTRTPATDPTHKAASDLAVLEKKRLLRVNYSSDTDFYNDSNIVIRINKDCIENATKIESMMSECYLMNYTGDQPDRANIIRLASNYWNDCAYITAKDKYEDYGIIGFYCYNQRESKLLCFAFSWRVTGMGIDKYIYNKLCCPAFNIHSSEIEELSAGLSTPVITEDMTSAITMERARNKGLNILLKVEKSLHPIEEYLVGGNLTTEYSYGCSPLEDVLPTMLYVADYHIVIYSLLQENYEMWENDGDKKMSEMFDTLEKLCSKAKGNPTVILLLGAENAVFEEGSKNAKLAELHSEINPIICDFAQEQYRIRTIKVSDYIMDKSDFNGSVNSFSVRVYSDIVAQIVVYINEKVDQILARK